MIAPEMSAILESAGPLLPLAFAGSLFSFGKWRKPAPLGKRTLETVNQAVYSFLSSRGVANFQVYTLEHNGNPVVLIKAEPQKKLRFSNILEIQIRKFLQDKLEIEVSGVFWRFKTDCDEQPGPEQADYGFDESPPYPQDARGGTPTSPPPDNTGTAEPAPAEAHENDELYSVQHVTARGMEVEEIPMGEFDEFLKGSLVGTEQPAADRQRDNGK